MSPYGTVYQDQALTQISTKYTNPNYVASQILPTYSVSKRSGIYYVYDKANLRAVDSERAIGSPANEVAFSISDQTFQTKDHALKEFVSDQDQDQADTALNPLMDATEDVTERLMVGKEKELASSLADTNTFTSTTLSGTDQWSDYTNSSPIDDMRTAVNTVHSQTGRMANTILLGKQTFDTLVDHPDIIDRIKYSGFASVTTDTLARLFEVSNVVIGNALENTAHEGATDSLGYVWGKHAWAMYVSPSRRLKDVTLGYSFTYGNQIPTKRWRDEDREGTYVRTNWDYTQKFVATDAAYFIKNATA